MQQMPSLQYAEQHGHYQQKAQDPRFVESRLIVGEINKMKVENPEQGFGIYDSLVDQLVKHSAEITRQPEHEREPANWTAPQRCVWRSSNLPYPKRQQVVEDKSIFREAKAFASVNGGRWLVMCPFTGCNGAQYASFHDRRFWCVDCENRAVAGQWVEVVWPSNLRDIENLLMVRPQNAMHWHPGETVEELAEQNQIAQPKADD